MREPWVLYLGGAHSLAFAVFHLLFWRIFQWRENLQRAGLSTRAILQIANLQLIWLFLGIAALCFWYTDALLHTPLGHAVCFGIAVFWLFRMVEQFIFLPYNRWYIHLLTALFLMGAILFGLPLI